MFGLADIVAAKALIVGATRRTPIFNADARNASVKVRPGENVCALICGAGLDGWS